MTDQPDETCKHGQRVKHAGITRQNKPYAGYFCRKDECKPEWAEWRTIVLPSLTAWAEK